MTDICVVDKRNGCCAKPKKEMKLIIENDRVKLETSDGYVMLSIQLDEKSIYFRDLQNFTTVDQYAEASSQDLWYIKERC